jgi:hypothetical protein
MGLLVAAALEAQDAAGVKFDTPQVRVVEAITSPGQRSAMHEHHLNRVMIYLDDGHETLTDAQGQVQDLRWHAGDVRWSPAGGPPHMAENVGGTTYRIVEVELKNAPGALPASDLDPVRIAPNNYKVEFENPQVRVLRARYGPHEAGPVHEHMLNRVTVNLTEQHMKVTAADGKVDLVNGTRGEVKMAGPAKHQEENVGPLPFEVVVVELKSAM